MTKAARVERALGYIRVSTQRQADGGVSHDNQETGLCDHYRRLGVELVEIYRDGGLSGTTDARPGLKALFDQALRPGGGITEFGVDSLCRLSRDPDLLDHHRRELKRASVRIVAIAREVGSDASSDFVRATGRMSSTEPPRP